MLDYINVKYWELAHSAEELGYHKSSDYSCKCDVCGDSNNKNKKRLHLYKKTSYESDSIQCFNCGYTANMYSYLRDHHPSLFNSYKQELGIGKLNALTERKPLEIRAVKKENILKTFSRPAEFIPITESEEGMKYISKRGFPKMKCYFSTGKVKLIDKEVMLKNYIIIPLLENGKWFGFYSRSIESKTFYTYLPEFNTGYKVWNFFGVNKAEEVYIFEAIFNAMSSGLKNCIAVLGSDIDPDRLSQLKKPIFVFDNDEAGRAKALKYADKGYKVALLPREYTDDINDLYAKKGMNRKDISELIKSNVVSGLKAKIMLKVQ